MTWFRVDDGFQSHPKVLAIPRGAARLRAIGLWTSVGTWCAKQLTDGRFAPHMIDEMGGNRADARALLQVGLWHHIGEGCDTTTCPAGLPGMHQFHDYLDLNPSREKVLKDREAAAARQKRARETRASRARTGHSGSHTESHAVTHASVTVGVRSPRPDPAPNAAAAASTPGGVTPLPPPLEILRSALEAHRLVVRWDRLHPEQVAEIEQLIETHGDKPLVAAAVRAFQPNKPAAFAQAWLPAWRELRRPGDLAVVQSDPCTEPGHSGTTRHCVQCASERKAAQ